MSQKRHPNHPGENRDPSRPIVTLAHDRKRPYRSTRHYHYRAQLAFAAAGVMRVATAEGTWVVPPEQAVWVPPGVEHRVKSLSPLALRFLYIHPRHTKSLLPQCCAVEVSPLLRQLILELMSLPRAYRIRSPESRLVAVALDQLALLAPTPLHLPTPRDPRLRAVAEKLQANPGDSRAISEHARMAGASVRTLERLFVRETGMTFGRWRKQLRLISAISRLSTGASVSEVAYELGYSSPSAFVAMFRRHLGSPPGRYIARRATAEKS